MEKGFSLIELMVVIGILAIIALVSTPVVNNVIRDSKIKAYDQQEKAIVDATKTYMANDSSQLPKNTNESVCISVKDLQEAGLISNKNASEKDGSYKTGIVNPAKNIDNTKKEKDEEFNGAVKVTYDGSKYTYTYMNTYTNRTNCS